MHLRRIWLKYSWLMCPSLGQRLREERHAFSWHLSAPRARPAAWHGRVSLRPRPYASSRRIAVRYFIAREIVIKNAAIYNAEISSPLVRLVE